MIVLQEIWLIRHCEAYNTVVLDNHLEVIDAVNPPLTALGEKQADELRDFLLRLRPERVIVSPLLRAVQTALPYLAVTGQKAIVDFRICETFAKKVFQDFQGMKRESYSSEVAGCLDSLDGIENKDKFPPYPESIAHIEQRTGHIWSDYQDGEMSKIVFIGHGASMAMLARHITGKMDWEVGHCNGGVSYFCRQRNRWTAVYINKTSHLSRTGPPAYI